ncbi:hypothetical protein BC828DRAFT_275318 [Blastocladiella britannica]|nr:hypothetical protein BC828DRAFT_275318 [Blastocladiella britannica]
MSNDLITTASTTYRALRSQPSKFSTGSDWNPRIDTHGGDMHSAMDTLRDQLARPGTPAARVLDAMGPPDLILPSINAVKALIGGGGDVVRQALASNAIAGAPGPFISGIGGVQDQLHQQQQPQQGKSFLVYFWRGVHDYLYFETEDDKVQHGEWINANE